MAQRTYRGGGGSGFTFFPAGTYPLRVHAHSDEISGTDGSPMILLKMDLINTAKKQAHKCREYLIIRDDMGWKMEKVLVAFKIKHSKILVSETEDENGELVELFDYTFDPDDFIGKAIMADIVVTRSPNKKEPGKFYTNYNIEQYRELIAVDPDWPISPWIEQPKSNQGGGGSAANQAGISAANDDDPF